MDWTTIIDWVSAIGDRYGVNPTVFGILYIGGLPFIGLAIAWMIRNRRARRPIHMPLFTATAVSASAYMYVIIAGENIPAWVYALLVSILVYGIWLLARKVRSIGTQ